MSDAADALGRIIADQEALVISGQDAVAQTLEVLRVKVATELLTVSTDSYASWQLRQTLATIDKQLELWASAARNIVDAGLAESWTAGLKLLPELASAAGMDLGTFWISSGVLEQLTEFTWGKIRGVAAEAATKIKAELTLGMLGQKSSQEIATAIVGHLPDSIPFLKGRPVFKSVAERAEVITGTELGRAFSMATQKSLEKAVETVPGLQKMWLHAGHPRVGREIHLLLHGQTREIDNPFYQAPGGYGVQFPRDPNAPIGEVIRCGCTHVPHHPDWGPAQDFADVFDARQHKLWTRKE